MTVNTRIYWLHALTPLHVGIGQGAGAIDLPIMRERVTGWPVVPGSAIKGVLADKHGATDENRQADDKLRAAFGRQDTAKGENNAGSLVFSDARAVCLPVRSYYGTFAWVTSPLVLERLRRDLDFAGMGGGLPSYSNVCGDDIEIASGSVLAKSGKVYLEDLDLKALTNGIASAWAEKLKEWVFPDQPHWQLQFVQRLSIVADDTFNFLCETATEVNARVRIDDQKKTVIDGALWYEEALPTEAILAGIVWGDRVFVQNGPTTEELLKTYCSNEYTVQIGGKASTGKGRVRCLFTPPIPSNTTGGDHGQS